MQLNCNFEQIVSLDNLLGAWQEFLIGKRRRKDVHTFQLSLMDNLLDLHLDLTQHTYRHGGYQAFKIQDPKPRDIHKASVRDRLLHRAIYRILYPLFDRKFISDSFSCRIDKGTHRAIDRFQTMAFKVSQNHTRTCWVLKLDIKKFFANIDHRILKEMLEHSIDDQDIGWLLGQTIDSFSSTRPGVGLPLGNLTSQLFVNIYMNEFDQFVKHRLKARFYIRYADDFLLLSHDRIWLEKQLPLMTDFLYDRLGLTIHPDKIFFKSITSGVDFLGWVHFFDHRVLRSTTKRRMLRRLHTNSTNETLQSYLGLLGHGNCNKLKNVIVNDYQTL